MNDFALSLQKGRISRESKEIEAFSRRDDPTNIIIVKLQKNGSTKNEKKSNFGYNRKEGIT